MPLSFMGIILGQLFLTASAAIFRNGKNQIWLRITEAEKPFVLELSVY